MAAEPSKAAANAKRLLTQDNVVLLINREPVVDLRAGHRGGQARQRAADVHGRGLPEGGLSAGRRRCSSAPPPIAGGYDSRATLAFIKETAKEPVRIGFAAMAIPLSRGEIDYAETSRRPTRHDAGRQGGDPAADRRLHAVRHQAQGCQPELGVLLGAVGHPGDDVRGAAPARLGGGLHHLGASSKPRASLARIKDGRFYVIGANSLFQDGLPIQKEIVDAAKAGQRAISGRADDRRLDRRHGARGRAQERRLAGRRRPRSAPRWRT